MKRPFRSLPFPLLCLVTLACLIATPRAQAQGKNILLYGNSFMQGGGGVHLIIRDVAIAAGFPTPNVVPAVIPGVGLDYHLALNTDVISTLPAGQFWDSVILQDSSNRPTLAGNIPGHRADALGLATLVHNNSPSVTTVMCETWARAIGSEYYLPGGLFPGGPAQMQSQLHTGYELSTGDIQAAFGPGSARFAPAGDAFGVLGFDPSLYLGDLYHPDKRGSLLAGLVLFSTIYDRPTSDLDLSALMARLGLTDADRMELTAAADAVIPAPSACGLAIAAGSLWIARRRQRPRAVG